MKDDGRGAAYDARFASPDGRGAAMKSLFIAREAGVIEAEGDFIIPAQRAS